MFVLSAVLLTFPASAYRTADVSQAIRSDVDAVLEDPTYTQLAVTDIRVEYDAGMVVIDPDPDRVVVTVTRPSDDDYPILADRIERQIERRTGDDVVGQVRYIEVDSSE